MADKLVEAGGRLPEERRLITALFADVSGFTSLADRLDPEQLLEVIDPVISGLSSVVGRYGPVSLGSGSHGSSRLHVRMLMLAVSSGSTLAASPTAPGSRTGRMPNC